MRILVFGQSGQVASALAKLAPDAIFLGRDAADLSVAGACRAAIEAHRPDAVINAAAYTQVDQAETDRATAQLVNAVAPGEMARACADIGIPLVHISTDYVFSGEGDAPWKPTDAPAPCNHYGATKLAGERQVSSSGACFAILRTSWVYSGQGSNFVKTMLRLSEARSELSIVDDQIGGPTPADAIAEAALGIASALRERPERSGTYHFTGAPDCSWAKFAEEVFHQAGRKVTVASIPTTNYPTPAKRPLNSRLDCQSTLATFGIERPDWRLGLRRTLMELGAAAA